MRANDRVPCRLIGSLIAKEPIMKTCEDPDYIVQGCYTGGYLCGESYGNDSQSDCTVEAERLSADLTFEGDYVRVITRDGELVCEFHV